MKVEDAIYNWLQIAVVYEARPSDLAAKETADFFREILTLDFNVEAIRYERNAFKYQIYYEVAGEVKKVEFDVMRVDKLIEDIENEPKYN